MKKTILIILAIGALPLTGCNFSPNVERQTSTAPTLGQQLMDLHKAEQAGAITPEQYDAKKAELLKN
jgi:hypothetical protein